MHPRLVSACLLSLTIGGSLVAAGPVSAQDLGRLAAQEAARRKAIAQPAKVITADDLGAAPAPWPVPQLTSSDADDDTESARRVQMAPAKYSGGAIPPIPIQAVSAGEVILEVRVDKTGRVAAVKPLRHTPPFTDAMAAAVRTWRFAPATDAPVVSAGTAPDPKTITPMDSTVLVVGLFRPPALFAPTLGEPPKDVAKASGSAPVPMVALEMPSYPVNALHDGVVLLELNVASHGGIEGVKVLKSADIFDAPALAAASSLIFRPGRVHDRQAAALVYVVAAFRQPVTF